MINLFLLGYATEFSEQMPAGWFGDPGIGLRIAFLVIGIVVSCIAAAFYYTADLGVSTYDAIPLHIADRKPIKKRRRGAPPLGICGWVSVCPCRSVPGRWWQGRRRRE